MMVACKDCIHDGVCYMQQVCDIEEQIAEFGCSDYKASSEYVKQKQGRWLLEAHKEKTNYRWNVTAECSECCAEQKEIWAGFFPGIPDWIAKDVALDNAESVRLSRYCPHCGARLRMEE